MYVALKRKRFLCSERQGYELTAEQRWLSQYPTVV